jgi:hypothetical protein
MTDYNILNTVFRTTTAFILIGALITVPLSAAVAEDSFLSAESHAAAENVADSFKDQLRLELAETIRPPTALRVNLVIATGPMNDVVQKDQLVSSRTAYAPSGDDT